MCYPLKTITLTAGEAAKSLNTLVSENIGDGLYLHRAEAGEQVFYSEIEDCLLALAADTPVNLVFYTETELLQDTIADAVQFTTMWTRRLPDVANALYAGQGSIDTLVQLGEALAWLQEISTQFAQRGIGLAEWPQRLYELAGELVRVVEGDNAAEQADFLLYELQDALDELLNRLTGLEVPGGDAE